MAITIRHVADRDEYGFEVYFEEQNQSFLSAPIQSPYLLTVSDRADAYLMSELKWTLEEFLDYPFPPRTHRATSASVTLDKWSLATFRALFAEPEALKLYGKFVVSTEVGSVSVESDDARILSWPWEAVRDEQHRALGTATKLSRKLRSLIAKDGMRQLPVPSEKIRILFVTARPYPGDVGFTSISKPILDLVKIQLAPVSVSLLRPPSLSALKSHLHAKPNYYHILHFDGHGDFLKNHTASNPLARGGVLIFENECGEELVVRADELGAVLRESEIPIVILNACRSAKMDHVNGNPFSSTAVALLRAGVEKVIAMSYLLLVSGAEAFLPEFYRGLFETRNLAEAARLGRLQMKNTSQGRFFGTPVDDWIMPVLYERGSAAPLSISGPKRKEKSHSTPPFENGGVSPTQEIGFYGRDGLFLQIERAIRKPSAGILLCGLSGIGKTRTAREFLNWFKETGGELNKVCWISFDQMRSAAGVINMISREVLGSVHRRPSISRNIDALAESLRKERNLIVWDNFETASGVPETASEARLSDQDLDALRKFLLSLRGGLTKVLITSRSEERWLQEQNIVRINLSGLSGLSVWEYAHAVLQEDNIPFTLEDETLSSLINSLAGHPQAIRIVLNLLKNSNLATISQALRENAQNLQEFTELAPLRISTRMLFSQMPPDTQWVLEPLSFFTNFVDVEVLKEMSKRYWNQDKSPEIAMVFEILSHAGLSRPTPIDVIKELHPLLNAAIPVGDSPSVNDWRTHFVSVLTELCSISLSTQFGPQQEVMRLHSANIYRAKSEALKLGRLDEAHLISDFIALVARRNCAYDEAERAYADILPHLADGDRAQVYQQMGNIELDRFQFEAAIKYANEALKINERMNRLEGLLTNYGLLGGIAVMQKNFVKAEGAFLHVLKIAEDLGKLQEVALTYSNLGRVCRESGRRDEARVWFAKALDAKRKQGLETANTLIEFSLFSFELEDYVSSLNYSKQALAELNENMDAYKLGAVYQNMGMALRQLKDFTNSEKYLLKAAECFESFGALFNAAYSYAELGLLAKDQLQNLESARWLVKGLATVRNLPSFNKTEQLMKDLLVAFRQCSPEEQQMVVNEWLSFGVGPFPLTG